MNSDENKVRINTIASVQSVIKNVLDDDQNINNMKSISTGFRNLDKITNGFQSGDLIVLASRPSMGKTALALNIVANVALRNMEKNQKNGTVLYFSPELSKEKLVARMIAAEGKLDFSKLCSGNMSDEDMAVFRDTCSKLSKTNIFIDDSACLTDKYVFETVKELSSTCEINLIVIDNIQLMATEIRTDNISDRAREVEIIIKRLKAVARKFNVPILLLSQLSRSVEMRTVKRPMRSDLRDAAAVEEVADVIMFLYREDFYNAESSNKLTELIIAKQRNGYTDTVYLDFNKMCASFSESRGK